MSDLQNIDYSISSEDGIELERYFKKLNYGALILNWVWAFAHRQWFIGVIFVSLAWTIMALTADIVITFLKTRQFPSIFIDVIVITFLLAERIIAIYLGAKGNRLAWSSGRFENLDELKATEAVWHKWAERIIWVNLILVIGAFNFILIADRSVFVEIYQDPAMLITVLTMVALVFILPALIVQRLKQ